MKDDRYGQAVIFECADELYAFDVSAITEINGRSDITFVPKLPPYITGVISLMGDVVPVIDLRRRLGLPEARYSERSCLIVIKSRGSAPELTLTAAVRVDKVVTSCEYDAEDLMKLPEQSVIAGYFTDENKNRVSLLNEDTIF